MFGGFREDIGFSNLQNEFGTLPDGSSLKIAHIEYVRDGVWAPEAVGELTGKSLTYLPSIPASFSYHGDEVGRVFYGSSSSIISGASQIRAFEAWNYFDYSLNVLKGIAPAVADWDVENHSYISNSGATSTEGARRLDFRIDRDGMTATVVLENGTGVIPHLFGNTYNTIVVGSSTGNHSRGGTTREGTGRLKPDIVGTANWTSYAGPIVGSAAGLLIAKAKSDPELLNAKRPEVVKALLMAGATKEEFPNWSRSATAPLDPVFGAGEVNVQNSYHILVAGRQQASSSALRSNRGWDLNSAVAGSSQRYFFTIGAGQSGTVSAVVTWHRRVLPINGAWNQGTTSSVDNLDLRLYQANSQLQTTSLLQDSVSSIDNVEHIFLRDLAEGTYALEVAAVSGSRQFGIAWMVSGVNADPQPPPPSVTAPAIDTQPVAQTVTQGSTVNFSVGVTGTSPFTYQWKKDGVAIAGATSSTHSIGSASSGDAGTYSVSVSNSAGSAISNGAFLTVNSAVTAPTITVQPSPKSVTEGAPADFSVTVEGTAPFTYQWKKDGASISGATGSSFTLSATTLSDKGTYTVVVGNPAGSVTSSGAYLTVTSGVTAPSITTQPSGQKVSEGSPVSFSVSATGSSPMTYQWRKDGSNMTGATSATLSLQGVTPANSGSYSVVLTNAAGSATSNSAYLHVSQVISAPAIDTQPAAQSVTQGSAVNFSVGVTGTSPFTYQWKKDGVAIAGATSSTHSIGSASSGDAGTYTVSVANSAGTALSNGAFLTVSSAATAPSITVQPSPKSVTEGAPAVFSVTVEGTSPFTYQWRKDGASIAGATGSSFTLSATTPSDKGTYSVVVGNSAGSATSSGAYLTVTSAVIAPSITTQPSGQIVSEGSAVTLTVSATGSNPLTYQWRKDGSNIAGAHSAALSLQSAAVADAGGYTVVVANSAGSATSNEAFLQVSQGVSASAPAITKQPVTQAVAQGSPAGFSVEVSGTSPFTYQWKKDGVAIAGATSNSFTINSASLADAASYTVAITNSAGTALSNAAYLTVSSSAIAPAIIVQPVGQRVHAGTAVSFSVSATGTDPMTYQWRKDGGNLAGADTATLTIQSPAPIDSGSYSVVVANAAGSATSSGAYLHVSQALSSPTITNQPLSATVALGSSVNFSVTASGSGPLAYQWRKNGATIAGASSSTLSILLAQASDAATYTVAVSNSAGSVVSAGAALTVQSALLAKESSRLGNISSRTKVEKGSGVLISGFVVSGTQPKTLLVRAVGPSLTNFDLTGLLERPMIRIYSGETLVDEIPAGARVPSVQATRDAATLAGAFSLPDTSMDSVVVRTFAPGGYTVHVSGADGGTGISIVEVYDLDASSAGGRVVNLSTRSHVGRVNNILILGVSVSGTDPKQVLIRAVGPGLKQYDVDGVLERPKIALYMGDTLVTENVGWTTAPNASEIPGVASRVGAFAFSPSSADSALLVTLPPGGYTLHVSGADGGTGVVLADVFEVQ